MVLFAGWDTTKRRNETAEKVLFPFEKEGLRGIIELKFLLISL
jgi:hypothetical protein